jgi:biopolymer transport protein ExbD
MAKKKESKQKKMNVRVDFTPMVDMMMLLITFFMLCTSLAKPQAMQLTMPSKDKATDEQKDKAKTDRLVTIYLAPDNKIYTYIIDKKELFGDETYLEEVSYGLGDETGKEGLRSVREVLRTYRPADATEPPVQAIINAKENLDKWKKAQPKNSEVVTDSIYEKALNMISKGYLDVVDANGVREARYKEILERQLNKTENPEELAITLAVNIKPMDDCTYNNLVTVLDEMAINCIGSYRISEVNDQDLLLLSKIGLVEAPASAAEPAAP